MGNNYPCRDCCEAVCPECGDCYCEDCDCQRTGTGTGFTNTSCCFRVVINGITEAGCVDGEGSACENTFNGTFYLSQGYRDETTGTASDVATGTGTGTGVDASCTWQHFLTLDCDEFDACGANKIQISIQERKAETGTGENEFFLRVEFGDHVWEKSYGTDPPACCEIGRTPINGDFVGEDIPHLETGDDCDSFVGSGSEATCLVTSWFRGCGEEICSDYVDGPVPCCFKIRTTGVSQARTDVGDCRHCECVDDTDWYAERTSSCRWLERVNPVIGDRRHCGAPQQIIFSKVGDKYRVTVITGNGWELIKEWDEKPKVDEWVDEIINEVSVVGDPDCDYSEGTGTGTGTSTGNAGISLALTPLYNFPEESCENSGGNCISCFCKPYSTPDMQIEVSGVTIQNCDWCLDLNGTFVLEGVGGNTCRWNYFYPDLLEGGGCPDATNPRWIMFLHHQTVGDTSPIIEIQMQSIGIIIEFEIIKPPGSELFDCNSFNNLDIPWDGIDRLSCVESGATCKLTAVW